MRGPGQPTLYHPDLCEQAHNYCLLGATNDELAAFFSVSPRTIDNWIATHLEFEQAVNTGRVTADAKVARGLYGRAVGYTHKAKRTMLHRGEVKDFESEVHYPPDTQACIFWLRNRRRRTWRESPHDPSGSSSHVDDIALLDAAGESVRHDNGD